MDSLNLDIQVTEGGVNCDNGNSNFLLLYNLFVLTFAIIRILCIDIIQEKKAHKSQ